MSGFAGEVRSDSHAPSAEALRRMSEALASRGPDGSGMLLRDGIGLVHRRLSTIDLSQQSQQPMVDSTLGLELVFSGALYNFKELREELQAKGYRFFSNGDAEVLLKAWHAWGEQSVERLQGAFAFAIRERDSGRLVLGRDRLGVEPLYWAEVDGALRFASTLPALLAGGGVDTTLDHVALHQYLTFHSVVPAPRTVFEGVRKLPPATLMFVEPDGTRTERCYWEVRYERTAEDERRPLDEWKALLLEALRRAVRRRLVADVPVGVLLSGGLDSSLLVGLIAETGQSNLKTFSIGFESVGGEEGDEFRYSDLIARHFGTDHQRIFIDSSRALPAVLKAIAAQSEPMVSHDNVGFYLLSQEVSRHVKVVQSGQGADEVFAGYHWYPPMASSPDPVAQYAQVFFDRDHREMAEVLDPRFITDDHSLAWVREHFARPGADDPVDKALRLDTTVMLVEDPAKRVDNMTMAFGLEARVPFLDHELVELAARMPPAVKLADGGKHVLKEAAREVIPAEVIDRPKGYFPVPALKYLRGPYLEKVREVLTDPRARRRQLVQPDYVARLMREPEQHLTPLRGSKLWQLAVLEMWLQSHGL